MPDNWANISSKRVGQLLLFVLLLIIGLRITSYFTLFPSSIGITRVVKILLRLVMTGGSIVLLYLLKYRKEGYEVQYQMALPLTFYCLYLFLGLLSVFWTTNLGFTLLQLVMTFESLVFVLVFYQVLGRYEQVYNAGESLFGWMVNRSVFVIGVIFIYGFFFIPETFSRGTHGGAVQRLGGFIINPNELGMLAVIGALTVFIEFLEKKSLIYNALAMIVCIAMLLLTQSRSSLGAFMLIGGIFVLMTNNYWVKVGSIVGAVFAIPIIVQTIILKQGDVEEVMSMTGRLPFWKDLITDGFTQSPILGFGFMSISPNTFSNKFDSIHAYAASMTHNTFVQVLINLGLVGALICLLQMVLTFYAIGVSENKKLKLLSLSMLIPLIINSTTEFGIFGESNYGILFYQFVIIFFTFQVMPMKQKITYR